MKLFFINWSGKDLGLVAVVKELQREHNILYWTCPNIKDEVNPADFPGIILHEHADALQGIGAPELSGENFSPPSQALLQKMYEAESIVLTMMNKHFEKRTVSERKHLYLNYVQYWDGVIQKYRPEAVVFSTIPHTSYDFVVYSLAKVYGIKTVMMEPTWVNDRMVIMTDYKEGPLGFRHGDRTTEIALQDLSEDVQKEYILQTRSRIGNAYVKNITKRYSGISALKIKLRSFWTTLTVLKDPAVFLKILTYLPRKLRTNQKTEYQSFVAVPDLNKKFVYFPLHYQPERNSSPQGGVFVDQILLAKTLSASLPEDWLLYIKEHPTQWLYRGLEFFSYRFRGFYKALAELRNVRIVPMETKSSELIKHAGAVATITGTAGWEALLNQKPVLIFGYPWYIHGPGVCRVTDVMSCRAGLEKIVSGHVTKEQDILSYLKTFENASFHGFIDTDGQNISKLTAKENTDAITFQISRILSSATTLL